MKKFWLLYLFFLSGCTSLQINVKSFENWDYNNNELLTYKLQNNNSLEENYYFQEIHKKLHQQNFVEDNFNPRFIIKAKFTIKENLYENLRPINIENNFNPWVSYYYGTGGNIGFSYTIDSNNRNIYTHLLEIEIFEKNNKIFERTASVNYKSNDINETYKFLIDSIFKFFPKGNAIIYTYIVNKKTGELTIKNEKHF